MWEELSMTRREPVEKYLALQDSFVWLTHPFHEVLGHDFMVCPSPPLGREVESYSGFALEGVRVLGDNVLGYNSCEVAPVEQSHNISHGRRAVIGGT